LHRGSRVVSPDIVSYECLENARLSHESARDLRRRATFAVNIAVADSAIRIAFSSLAASRWFATRFVDMRVARDPSYAFYIVDEGARTCFWSDPGEARVWPFPAAPAPVMSFLADNAAMNDFFRRGPYLGLHAAVVRAAGGPIAILGATTAGKTTTALACAQLGLQLFSDERCILRSGMVFPFLRSPTLRAGGRRLLARDFPDDGSPFARIVHAPAVDGEVSLPASTLFAHAGPVTPEPLRAVAVIDGIGAQPSLREVDAYAVLPELAQATSAPESGLDRVARLLAELRDARCFRLRLGRPRATAEALAQLPAGAESRA
jgi:hypothetical protein